MNAEVEASHVRARDAPKSISTSSLCYLAGVPIEVLTAILSRAVNGSNKTLYALCGVCLQWREILFDVPHVWKNLDLTGKSFWTPDKVDAWLKRARGSLSRLYVSGECKVLTEDDLYKRIPWLSIQELCIVRWRWVTKDYFLPEIANQLQVESLELSGEMHVFPSFLERLETERLRSFVCRIRCRELPLDKVASSSLTRLELSGAFAISELLVLLDRNPMIETMALAKVDDFTAAEPVVGAGNIELAHLTHLRLRNCHRADIILRAIRFPNVRTLVLSSIGDSCIRILATHQIPHLEKFQFTDTDYDHRSLISFLRNALALRTLSIHSCYEFNEKVDRVIQALTEVIPQGSATAVGTLCCPRLQEVEISDVTDLSTSSLLRLVGTRLNGVGNGRIFRLYLDDSDSAFLRPHERTRSLPSEQDVKWLRTNIPDFRYEREGDTW